MRSRNPPKIDRHPSLDPKVSLLVLRNPLGSLSGPPRCQSGINRHAKWHVFGTKTDTLRAPNHCELKTRDVVETASRYQRANTNFSREISKNIQQTTSQSKGAAGMGEALRYYVWTISKRNETDLLGGDTLGFHMFDFRCLHFQFLLVDVCFFKHHPENNRGCVRRVFSNEMLLFLKSKPQNPKWQSSRWQRWALKKAQRTNQRIPLRRL